MTELNKLNELDSARAIDHCFANILPVSKHALIVNRTDIVYWYSRLNCGVFNTVRSISSTPQKIPELVDEVVAAHRGGSSSWHFLSTTDNSIQQCLSEAGYKFEARATSMWMDTHEMLLDPSPRFQVEVVNSPDKLKEYIAVDDEVFDAKFAKNGEVFKTIGTQCLGREAIFQAFIVYDLYRENRAVGVGRLYLYPDIGFGYLHRSGVALESRNRGAYTELIRARLEFAKREKIRRVGLYGYENTTASILLRKGFNSCGSIEIWKCDKIL